MYQFHPSNPFRPVNWRWERARCIFEKKPQPYGKKPKEDIFVLDALEFQRKFNKCKSDADRWQLMDDYPDIYAAYLIRKRGDDEDRHPMKYAVEARILAGQSFYEISSLQGVSPKVIEYYVKLFFDVEDKLHNTDYIMNCIIGPSIQSGLTDRDYDLLWKLFGYLYGPVVLNTFINTASRNFRPDNLNEVDAALAEDARSSIQRKVAIVARTFTVNPFSQSELLNLYARLVEMEKATDSGKAHDVILQNVQVMLDKLPFSVGDQKSANVLLEKHDNAATELRTDELLKITAENAEDAEIEQISYPSPTTKVH